MTGPPALPRTAVPWYVHPAEDPAAWQQLAGGPAPSFVVVNVHDGPGAAEDPWYPAAIDGLRGLTVLGYVPMTWGERSVAAVREDVRAWVGRYRVSGVMLDEFPSGDDDRAWRGHVQAARDSGAAVVVGNPGVVPARAQLEALDVTCVFEGTAADHARSTPHPVLRGLAPGRLWHLVHTCPPASLARTLAAARAAGAGHAFATDRTLPHPWGGFPRSHAAPVPVQPQRA